jgi:hypothetical protein
MLWWDDTHASLAALDKCPILHRNTVIGKQQLSFSSEMFWYCINMRDKHIGNNPKII